MGGWGVRGWGGGMVKSRGNVAREKGLGEDSDSGGSVEYTIQSTQIKARVTSYASIFKVGVARAGGVRDAHAHALACVLRSGEMEQARGN